MEEEDAMDTEGVATSPGTLQSPLALASNCPTPQSVPHTRSLLPLPTLPPGPLDQSGPSMQAPEALGAQGCSRTLEEVANTRYTSAISQQISVAEFNIQTHYVTQQALRDLKASPEYQKYTMRCHR